MNIDIKIKKLVRGQGLAKFMAYENLETKEINQLSDDCKDNLCDMDTSNCYKGIIFYLKNMKTLSGMTNNQNRALKL